MAELLFIYGSLLNPQVQEKVIGRRDEGKSDILEKHTRIPIFIEGQKYFSITPDNKKAVEGKIISLTTTELEKIDLYEEPEYTRKKITLKSGVATWVYTYTEHKTEGSWL